MCLMSNCDQSYIIFEARPVTVTDFERDLNCDEPVAAATTLDALVGRNRASLRPCECWERTYLWFHFEPLRRSER